MPDKLYENERGELMISRRGFVSLAAAGIGVYLFGTKILPMIPLDDNPDIKDSDLYVVQEWHGKPTAGRANDNFASDVRVYLGSGKSSIKTNWLSGNPTGTDIVASGAPIGTLHLEDRGVGESMIARDVNGDIIASWQERVERSWKGWFGMKGSLVGYLKDPNQPVVVMPEDIPVVSRMGTVKLGVYENGEILPSGQIDTIKVWNGLAGGRGGTIFYRPTIRDGEVVALEKILYTDDGWEDWLSLPTKGDAYDGQGKLLYKIKPYWWDGNPRSWWDGFELTDASGRVFAKIDVDDRDYSNQLGYVIYADKGKGLEKLGAYVFKAQEREEQTGYGDDRRGTGVFQWVGELWAKLEGGTKEEKMKNLKLSDYVMKLLPDQVQIDDDDAMFNIEEYIDFARLLTEPSPETLANASTSADILDLQEALDVLVYKKKTM